MEVRKLFAGLSDRPVRTVACAAGLLLLSSVGWFIYLRLRRRSHPPSERPLPAAQDPIMMLEEPEEEEEPEKEEPEEEEPEEEEPEEEEPGVLLSSEVSLSPEKIEVPFISSHLVDSGITDVFLKLQALREAFSILLSSSHTQNLLFVAGKKLVKHLAAANKRDVVRVQLAYESLIRFLRSPSHQEAIRAELMEADIQHLNFIDIIFELIFFRWIMRDSLPEISGGGFLEQLFLMIRMWDTESWEPAAEQFFALLVIQILSFLGILFSQPLDLYSDPAALARVVLDLLKEQVQVLTKTMKGI